MNDYKPLYKTGPGRWERVPLLAENENTPATNLVVLLVAGLVAITCAAICTPYYFLAGCGKWFDKFRGV